MCAPTLPVTTGAQPCEAMSAVLSVAVAVAVAAPLSTTGLGLTVGASAGAVASRLMVTDTGPVVPPALVARQARVVPAVSALMVVGPQPADESMADSGSVTVQLTLTSLVYQPLLPSVPVMMGAITGAVV